MPCRQQAVKEASMKRVKLSAEERKAKAIANLNQWAQPQPVEVRFWRYVDKSDPNGCWVWTGTLLANGYGHISVGARPRLVHRVSYEMHVGPIPDGLQIDHLCRNRRCVNPAHLEAVTARVNTLRAHSITAANSRKIHCPHGHPYSPENTVVSCGRRLCRICRTAQKRAQNARLKAERNAAGRIARGDWTHCPRGHEYTSENTIIESGHVRRCRT